MDYKALVIDIDGTITYPDRRLDFRAVEKINSLDIPTILATGNTVCFASAAAKLIGTTGIVICENGGLVRMGYDKEYILLGDIAPCERAYGILSHKTELERLDSEYRKTEIALRRTNVDVDGLRAFLKEMDMGVDIIDSGFALHIKEAHIDKSVGMVKVAELMGVGIDDFIAIGDSENDLEMIKKAGTGVAVGNADERLKKAADMVTRAEYGAGVAEAIDELLGK